MGSSNASLDLPWFLYCIYFGSGPYVLPSFTVVWSLLVFPLYFLVLRTGFQRWRKNKRSSVTHAEFFTYNTFLFEVIALVGYIIFSVASFERSFELTSDAVVVLFSVYPGLLSLQVLTCVERFLAVVYPVLYLSLKRQKWITARKVLILVIWGICVLWALVVFSLRKSNIALVAMMVTAAAVIVICSIQVLCALRNPSPGEGHRVSVSKRKAFCTMLLILMVLILWLAGATASTVLDKTKLLDPDSMCRFQLLMCWFELPGSLVLPLLFLHRAGKLPQCRGKRGKNLRG